MKKEKLWGFFKRCSKCSQKIPPSDGHKLCLFCLGEMHNVDACGVCARFSRQAKRNRAAHLSVFLLEKSLRPQELPMEPKALDTSASTEAPVPSKKPSGTSPPEPNAPVPGGDKPAKASSKHQGNDLPQSKVAPPLTSAASSLTKQPKLKKHK